MTLESGGGVEGEGCERRGGEGCERGRKTEGEESFLSN